MIIPVGHENNIVRRLPWVTFIIMGLCIIIHTSVSSTMDELKEKFIRTTEEFVKYYLYHPYLKFNPEIQKLLFRTEEQKKQFELIFEVYQKQIPEADILEEEQEKFDQIALKLIDIIKDVPYRKWGLIPANKSFPNFLTYMFIHVGWLHLIFNLLFLYLTGPFIEDVWGRPIYLAFYIFMGILSAQMYSVHYPNLIVPLVGASGAIAGVMGAFLIRYWKTKIKFFFIIPFPVFFGTFSAPAWLMMPLWLLVEFSNAKAMDSIKVYGGGGVAHWAHIWGFVFGIAAAFIIKIIRVEEKHIKPKVVDQMTYVNKSYEIYEEAMELVGNGNIIEAYAMLLDGAKKDPTHQDIVEALWNLAPELEKVNEASGFLIKLIEKEVRRNQFDLALYHYRLLKMKVPDAFITSHTKIMLMETMINQEQFKEAEELYSELIKDVDLNSPPGLLLDFSRVVLKLDLKSGFSLAPNVIELALRHPDIPENKKDELKASLYEIKKETPEGKETGKVESSMEYAALPLLPDQAKTKPEKKEVLQSQRNIKVTKVVPISLKGAKISLNVEKIGQRVLKLDKVKSIAVIKISSEGERPFFLIDLFLDDPTSYTSDLRIIRLFSTNFSPQKFVSSVHNPLDAFIIFTSVLLRLSDAKPYPDLESVQLKKIKVFPTIKEYENSLLGNV